MGDVFMNMAYLDIVPSIFIGIAKDSSSDQAWPHEVRL